jgi:polyisoprenoid-binding protein YceI
VETAVDAEVNVRFLAILTMTALAPLLGHTQPACSQDDSKNRIYLWAGDPEHSSIVFQTTHWGVVDIVGWFEGYEITVRSRELDFSDAVVEARIDPASVRMPNPGMAANLRGLFFVVEEFPEVLFRSTRVERTDKDGVLKLTGAFTMKGVTKELDFTVHFNGYGSPPQGSPGFKLEGVINRLDFEVGDLELMEGTGHPMVAPEVRITANIRLEYVRSEFE